MTSPSFVYFVQAGEGGNIKIGVTNNIRRRITMLQTGCHEQLKLLRATEGGTDLEQKIHGDLATFRLHGEWFKPHAQVLEYMMALPPAADATQGKPRLFDRPPKTKLHAWRLARGITAIEFAKRAGICRALVSHIENGNRSPNWITMKLIYDFTEGAIEPNDFAPFLRAKTEVKSA